MVKTCSKYTNELPNILFNQMFTCFSCARQNVASVMDTFRENCPLGCSIIPDLKLAKKMAYPEWYVGALDPL